MTITTSKGKTFAINWAWALSGRARLMMELNDRRPIAEIAADFDGCSRFERKSEAEGDAIYEGYTRLVSVIRDTAQGTVTLALAQGETEV